MSGRELTVLTLLVTEVLGDGKTSKSDTGTSTRGLVHLTKDQGHLGLALELNDRGLLHFVVTTVSLGDVVDQLLNEHGLADTGTTEETDLSTTSVGSEQIDDLDTSDQNLGRGGLVSEGRRLSVDRQELVSLDRATLVNRVTGDVHDTAESGRADRDGDGGTGVLGHGTTDETLGTCDESERAPPGVAETSGKKQ